MRIPERLYPAGQVAVDPEGTAHRLALVVVEPEDQQRWKGKIMSTGGNGRSVRYGVGCIADDSLQPHVACYSAQWAAQIVGITEACTGCWPDEEGS